MKKAEQRLESQLDQIHGKPYAFISGVVCCDCKTPLDEQEEAENAKNKKDESVRCYYCYRDNAISKGEIGWL